MDTLAIELPLASNFFSFIYSVYVCVCICIYVYVYKAYVCKMAVFFLNIWQLASVSQAL